VSTSVPGTGPGDILALIRRSGVCTRGEIQRITGLSRMTVGQRLAPLVEQGLLRGAGPQGRTGGRPPQGLEFNPGQGVVLAAALETTRCRTAVTDLAGRILRTDEPDVSVQAGPRDTLDAVCSSLLRLLEDHGADPSAVRGVGVSLPGPVDPATGRPSEPPIMPGWDGFAVAEHVSARTGSPVVVVDNDANAMALGEYVRRGPDGPPLVLVKVSTGIGAGIVIDGEIYQGVDGGAGDIGHVRTQHEGRMCRCGARGCLAATASGWAVAAQLTELGVPAVSGHDVQLLLAAGDPHAARLTREAGRLIGDVAATVVSVLSPGTLLLGGDLASTALLSGVRERLYLRTLPRATRHLRVELAAIGADAALEGITRTVVDRVFAPAAVNERLAGQGPGSPDRGRRTLGG